MQDASKKQQENLIAAASRKCAPASGAPIDASRHCILLGKHSHRLLLARDQFARDSCSPTENCKQASLCASFVLLISSSRIPILHSSFIHSAAAYRQSHNQVIVDGAPCQPSWKPSKWSSDVNKRAIAIAPRHAIAAGRWLLIFETHVRRRRSCLHSFVALQVSCSRSVVSAISLSTKRHGDEEWSQRTNANQLE